MMKTNCSYGDLTSTNMNRNAKFLYFPFILSMIKNYRPLYDLHKDPVSPMCQDKDLSLTARTMFGTHLAKQLFQVHITDLTRS